MLCSAVPRAADGGDAGPEFAAGAGDPRPLGQVPDPRPAAVPWRGGCFGVFLLDGDTVVRISERIFNVWFSTLLEITEYSKLFLLWTST